VKFKWAVFVGILACLGSGAAQAQTNPNLEIGFKPFGSYDGTDIDSVNLYTWNAQERVRDVLKHQNV